MSERGAKADDMDGSSFAFLSLSYLGRYFDLLPYKVSVSLMMDC